MKVRSYSDRRYAIFAESVKKKMRILTGLSAPTALHPQQNKVLLSFKMTSDDSNRS